MAGPELVVKFDADISKFQKGLSDMQKQMADLEASTKRVASTHARMGQSMSRSAAQTNAEVGAVQRLTTSLNKLNDNLDKAIRKNEEFGGGSERTGRRVASSYDSAGSSLAGMAKQYLAVAAVVGAGKLFVDTAVEVESFQSAIKAAGRSQEDYAKNMAFVESVGEEYRKNTLELGKAFAALANATKGTNLEGAATHRLFKATIAASTALKLSMDDTTGTIRAFAQMVSKGNVQAEELRGQLGERLYGAFQLAAKAMGVNTSELNKMLERGEVLASDLLPKITVEMEKAFGQQAIENASTLGNNIEYATGQVKLFFAEFGKESGITGFMNHLAEKFGDIAKSARDIVREEGVLALPAAAMDGAMQFAVDPMDTGLYNGGDPFRLYRTQFDRMARMQSDIFASRNAMKGVGLPGEVTSKYGLPSKPRMTMEDSDRELSRLKREAKRAVEEEKKARQEAEKAAREALNRQRDQWALEDAELALERARKQSEKIDKEIAQMNERLSRKVDVPAYAVGRFMTGGVDANSMGEDEKFKKRITPLANKGGGDIVQTSFSNDPDRFLSAMRGRIEEMNQIPGMDWAGLLNTQALNDQAILMDEVLGDFNADIKNAMANAAADALYGMAAIAGAMASGTASMEDVGQMIAGVLSRLASQIGQSLMTMGSVLMANPATAPLGLPYMITGGLLMAASGFIAGLGRKKKEPKVQHFATGGIVKGPGGIDNVPAMLTAGEMVLNHRQQREMFGLLDGARHVDSAGGSTIQSFRVSGNDLLFVIEQAQRSRKGF